MSLSPPCLCLSTRSEHLCQMSLPSAPGSKDSTFAAVLQGIFCSYIDVVFLEQATHINMSLRAFDYPATTAYTKDHLVQNYSGFA